MELEYESKRPCTSPTLVQYCWSSHFNKGSAFTNDERNHFNLHGLLPEAVETIEEQAERAYRQYQDFKNDDDKHIYLRNIQDTNETLFYRLLEAHLSEMMPLSTPQPLGKRVSTFLIFIAVHAGYLFPIRTANTLMTCYKMPPNKMLRLSSSLMASVFWALATKVSAVWVSQ